MRKLRIKKAIVLLSGGIDSAVTLYLAKKKGFECTALIFDYGQKHNKEVECAKKIARETGIKYEVMELPFLRSGSSLVDKKMKIPVNRSLKDIRGSVPSTYVPARNIIFLSVATSLAEATEASSIFIGAHTQDYSGYPDCRKGFFDAFKKTIDKGTKNGKSIKVLTPLIGKGKKEIIQAGIKLKVPFELTWSCYKGGIKPCGACDSCRFRQKAFEELNMEDPYYERSQNI